MCFSCFLGNGTASLSWSRCGGMFFSLWRSQVPHPRRVTKCWDSSANMATEKSPLVSCSDVEKNSICGRQLSPPTAKTNEDDARLDSVSASALGGNPAHSAVLTLLVLFTGCDVKQRKWGVWIPVSPWKGSGFLRYSSCLSFLCKS